MAVNFTARSIAIGSEGGELSEMCKVFTIREVLLSLAKKKKKTR